jgi:hypothetical protein
MSKQEIFEELEINNHQFYLIQKEQLVLESIRCELTKKALELESQIESLIDREDQVLYAEMENTVEYLDLIDEYEIQSIVELCLTGK